MSAVANIRYARPVTAVMAVSVTALAITAASLLATADSVASTPRRPAAHPTATMALTLTARQSGFSYVDNAPSGDSAGDLITTSDSIYSRGSRTQLGHDDVVGIETVKDKTISLTDTIALRRGSITLQGLTTEQNSTPYTLAVTGGTGDYRGASGVARISPKSRTVSQLSISLDKR